jgi:hypothetical protein
VRNILVKDLAAADEVREAPKARIEVFWFPSGPVYRVVVEPEWRWSESLKETFGTTRCPADHIAHMISGQIAIEMEDGAQRTFSSRGGRSRALLRPGPRPLRRGG